MLLRLLIALAGLVAAAPPNVVLILSDDQAWGDYSFMGHPHIRTPHLDRLAAQSLTFRRGYVPSSLCRPSLATIITGLYPHQHKITSNDPALPTGKTGAAAQSDPEFRSQRQAMIDFIDDVPTLPRLLGKHGYLSFQSGKWWEGHYSRGGFTHGMTHGDPQRGGRHGDEGLKIGREGMQPIFNFLDLAAEQQKPFFLWYAPLLPHEPHNPPQRLLDKYRDLTPSIHVARYWAMCEWFDETCGELLDDLDRRGLADNTLVIYITDNGWIQKPQSAGYAPRSKRSPYECGIRTPIMLRWPGHIEPRDSTQLASSIDLAPTVLAAVGLKSTTEMQGLNLLDAEAIATRDTLYGEIFEHNAVDLDNPASSLMYRWIIDGDWKLIVPTDRGVFAAPKLFDLGDDPHEERDMADQHPDIVRRLQQRLDEWWSAGVAISGERK